MYKEIFHYFKKKYKVKISYFSNIVSNILMLMKICSLCIENFSRREFHFCPFSPLYNLLAFKSCAYASKSRIKRLSPSLNQITAP